MLTKTFMALYELDIAQYVRFRPEDKGHQYGYLPWNICLKLLYENGAETVRFEPVFNESGHSIFFLEGALGVEHDTTTKRKVEPTAPEVHVRVVVDDRECITAYPIINGTEVLPLNRINQQLVNTARQRAFVKGVAQMTGLGLRLWEKGDEGEDTHRELNVSEHSIAVCLSRISQKYADKARKLGNEDALLRAVGATKKQIANLLEAGKSLRILEGKLDQL